MLPEYDAISFQRIIEKGGHTQPWVIVAKTPQGLKSFVVKLYTTLQVESRNSVTAEVVGNVLAKEFDLVTPSAALIRFSEDFTMQLGAREQQIILQRDERIKFGTELIEGNFRFETGLPKRQLTKRLDMDTLYAFDNYIRNSDRGTRKPNLLLTKEDAWLIDHELALNIDSDSIVKFEDGHWEDMFARYHICREYLRKARVSTKRSYFNTFCTYLEGLNLNKLHPYFRQLESHGYYTKSQLIISYLQHLRRNSVKFTILLKGFLQ